MIFVFCTCGDQHGPNWNNVNSSPFASYPVQFSNAPSSPNSLSKLYPTVKISSKGRDVVTTVEIEAKRMDDKKMEAMLYV